VKTENHTTDRLAVLIDAGNAKASLIEPLLKEIGKYGSANVKTIDNHRYKKLGELIRTVGLFEIKETPREKNPGAKDLQIKLKPVC
jgi:predicted neutral ceramidase superfamily lipid hydrolase